MHPADPEDFEHLRSAFVAELREIGRIVEQTVSEALEAFDPECMDDHARSSLAAHIAEQLKGKLSRAVLLGLQLMAAMRGEGDPERN